MYDWLLKDKQGEAQAPDRQDQDVWTWTVIGLVAVGTLLVVWLPVLVTAAFS